MAYERDPFLYHSEVRLGGTLVTTIKVGLDEEDEPYKRAHSIDLNDCLGVSEDGTKLDRTKTGLFNDDRVKDARIYTGSNTLSVKIMDQYEQPQPVTFNLDLVLFLRDEKYWSIGKSKTLQRTTSATYVKDGYLYASCLDNYGNILPGKIDLNKYYEIKDGEFITADTDNGLQSTADPFSDKCDSYVVIMKPDGLFLQANTKKDNGDPATPEVNLSICIENDNGELKFVKHDDFWDRDGWAATNIVDVPGLGLIVAALQYAAGNKDFGDAAITKQIKVTGVVAVGAVAGLLAGPVGAALIAAASSSIGSILEHLIARRIVDDDRLLANFNEATLWSVAVDFVTSLASSGAGEYLSRVTKLYSAAQLDKLGGGLRQKLTEAGIDAGTGWVADTLTEAIKEGPGGAYKQQWTEVIDQFNKQYKEKTGHAEQNTSLLKRPNFRAVSKNVRNATHNKTKAEGRLVIETYMPGRGYGDNESAPGVTDIEELSRLITNIMLIEQPINSAVLRLIC